MILKETKKYPTVRDWNEAKGKMNIIKNILSKSFQIICIVLICFIVFIQYGGTKTSKNKTSFEKKQNVLYSSPYADHIKGYGGPISLAVELDDNKTIQIVEVLEHSENPLIVDDLIKQKFLHKWQGLSLEEAAKVKVDVVSGATMTSSAIIETVKATLVFPDKSQKKGFKSQKKSINEIDVLVLSALFFSFLLVLFPQKSGRYQFLVYLLNIVVLGFVAGKMFSLALFLAWIINGPPLTILFGLFCIVFFSALFFNKNIYCHGICPYGCMQVLCATKIASKKQIKHYSRIFKYIKVFLFFSIFLILVFGVRFNFNNVEPFSAFFIKTAKVVPVILFMLFIVLSAFVKRPWCKICPTGAILQFFTVPLKGGKDMKVYKGLLVAALVVIIGLSAKLNQNFQSNDMLKIIHQRKSVRNYTDRPVSKEKLLTIVKAGMAAPTAMNKQPWTFIMTTEKEILAELSSVLAYGKMIKNAGATITVCGVPSEALPGEANRMWVQDCSAATENILLAAEALGLGAVWVGIYPIQENINKVRKVLKMSGDVVPLAVVSIGYPKGTEKPKDKYKPTKVHWQKW